MRKYGGFCDHRQQGTKIDAFEKGVKQNNSGDPIYVVPIYIIWPKVRGHQTIISICRPFLNFYKLPGMKAHNFWTPLE